MKNIAIVGTGGIASQHLQSYLAFPDRCRVDVAQGDNPAKTAARADEFGLAGVRQHQDYRVMFADSTLDADVASIATPPFTHRDIAVAASES